MDDSAAIWPAIAFVIVFAAIAIMIESAQSVGMFVGGILLVVVVGIILASRRRASERAHRRAERIDNRRAERIDKRVEQQNIYEQAYNRVFAHVDKVIHRHQSVLIAKRRQKTYTDDYGRFIDEAWFKEMLYFYQNVVMGSELDPSINESTLARAASHARYKMPGIHADSSRQRLDAIIITLIDDTVQQLDQESSDAHVRERNMTPDDYERYCADLLAQVG